MKENDLQKKIRDNLRINFGGKWMKIHGSIYQETGIPDLIGVCKGKFFALEVKLPGKEATASDMQKLQIKQIAENGGYATVVSSVADAITFVKRGLENG